MLRLARLSFVGFLLAAGCGESSGKTYNESCSSDSNCATGLCPTKGPMTGKCTISCSKDEHCTSVTNSGAVCTSDVCAPKK